MKLGNKVGIKIIMIQSGPMHFFFLTRHYSFAEYDSFGLSTASGFSQTVSEDDGMRIEGMTELLRWRRPRRYLVTAQKIILSMLPAFNVDQK